MSQTSSTAAVGVELRDANLFRQAAYIDGAWVQSPAGATIEVDNPATGEIVGTVPKLDAADTRRAIDAAARALGAWRARTAKERAAVLRRWLDLMMTHQEDLARLMTTEQGKPLAESRGEVAYAASFLEWFGEEAKRVYGDTIPGHQADKRIVVIKQPIGVVGVHHAMELSAGDDHAEGRSGARSRLHRGAEACIADAVLRARARRAGGARRRPERRAQHRHRLGHRDRRRAHREPARAQALVHRLDGRRQAADGRSARRP